MCGKRLQAHKRIGMIHQHYFNGTKKLAKVDCRFINSISRHFISLISTVLYHTLSDWQSGEYQVVAELIYVNCGGR